MVTVAEILDRLSQRLSEKRLVHSRNVARTAAEIARKEGQPVCKAVKAGLLHDYARGLDIEELRIITRENSLKIDEYEWKNPILLHAPVGAFLVQQDLKINDGSILKAIRYHTTGYPEMDKLGLIIFLSDIIEPGRDFPGVIKIRREIENGLESAVISACDLTLQYNIVKKRIIHPHTLMLRNKLLEGSN
ncbi:MAG: bis(5'-nucleosyl)-tetraphosphatase (symmetrical) YqeK [Halanaerobiaceae bacterium]